MRRSRPPLPSLLLAVALAAILAAVLAVVACRPADPAPGDGAAPASSPSDSAAPQASGPAVALPEPAPATAADPAGGRGPSPDLPRDRPLRAGFLVVEGVYNTELAAPYAVFQHTAAHAQPGMEVFAVSPTGEPVTTFEGLRIAPRYGFANAPEIDVLVVPSTRGSMDRDLADAALVGWVRDVGSRARTVMSLDDGAFVLAKAGLLDGLPATTFPEDYQRFAQAFPQVDLRVNVSFVRAGKALTSQGGVRSYQAALHLVDELYGTRVAQAIGQGLLVAWPPELGSQPPAVVETGGPAPAALTTDAAAP